MYALIDLDISEHSASKCDLGLARALLPVCDVLTGNVFGDVLNGRSYVFLLPVYRQIGLQLLECCMTEGIATFVMLPAS